MIKQQNLAAKKSAAENHFNSDKFVSDSLNHNVYIEKNEVNQLVYKVEIIVGDFKPNEIKLKLKGKKLVVHAAKQSNKIKYELSSHANHQNELRHLIRDSDPKTPSKVSTVKEHEEFKREIILPSFVKPETIVSFLETYEDKSENTLLLEGEIDSDKLELEPTVIQNPVSNIAKQKSPVTPTPVKKQSNSEYYSNISEKTTTGFNSKMSSSNGGSSDSSSIDQMDEYAMENYSCGVLKYKFDLKDFESSDINISIKNKEILVVSASNSHTYDFYREIKLPKNSEIHNIRNCFDESIGILRIEIPLANKTSTDESLKDSQANKLTKEDNKKTTDDKYLELVFDLHDYKFDQIDVQKNEEDKNILIVKAVRITNEPNSYTNSSFQNNKNSSFTRKYILPDWVSNKNIKILEEKKLINGEKKNLLVLHIPFL